MDKNVDMKKSLEQYYLDLQISFSSPEVSAKFNNDRTHNAVIMSFMLDHSNQISMYCGELSVFRDSFYDKIEKDYGIDIADYLKTLVKKSLKEFLSIEGNQMNLILENSIDNDTANPVFSELLESVDNSVSLVVLPEAFALKKDLSHFTFTDTNIIRLEEDKQQHNAICICNGHKYIKTLKENFNKLKQIANN